MNIKTSWHNHSTWSDGESTPREMILAAKDAGYTSFGITDHFIDRPDKMPIYWSMDITRLDEYVAEMRNLQVEFNVPGEFSFHIGMEVDYYEENAVEVATRLRQHGVEYLIGSSHFVENDIDSVDDSADYWLAPCWEGGNDRVWRLYQEKVCHLCGSGLYEIIGHLDLPKKYCFMPSWDATPDLCRALDALAVAGGILELNCAGYLKDCHEPYPSRALIEYARKKGIRMTVCEDAHSTAGVGALAERGAGLLRDCGYTEVYCLL